jgi:hypothetical protein
MKPGNAMDDYQTASIYQAILIKRVKNTGLENPARLIAPS